MIHSVNSVQDQLLRLYQHPIKYQLSSWSRLPTRIGLLSLRCLRQPQLALPTFHLRNAGFLVMNV